MGVVEGLVKRHRAALVAGAVRLLGLERGATSGV
jgi:hypothetical protein